ncbi:MAG: hypothetical protein ACK4GQ_05905 [Candidatus Hadarchaeales archaeon]
MAKTANTRPKVEAREAKKQAPPEPVASRYIRRLHEYLVAMGKLSAAYERYRRSRKTSLTEWAVQLELTREGMKKESEGVRPLVEKLLGEPIRKETPVAEAVAQRKFNGAGYFKIIEREVMESIRLVNEFKELEKKAANPFIFNENVEKTALSLVALHESVEEEFRRVYKRFL